MYSENEKDPYCAHILIFDVKLSIIIACNFGHIEFFEKINISVFVVLV